MVMVEVPAESPFLNKLSPPVRSYLRAGLQVNFPPPGYDPREASDASLKEHFLPPRPNAGTAPRAFALWQKGMSGSPVWPTVPKGKALLDDYFAQSELLSHPRLAGPSNTSFEAASSNWSGAFVRPPDFSHMQWVQGLWTVPDVVPPSTQAGDYASSAWLGLDGYYPASRSLPQIGTGQWVTADSAGNLTKLFFAWWQWFVRDGTNNRQILIRDVPVAPGDLIYAQVYAVAPMVVGFFIHNLTSNGAFPMWFRYKSPIQPALSPSNPLPAHIEGNTAAWIFERPAQLGSAVLYPLPDYGSTVFEACLAGTDSAGPTQEVDLERAHLLRMVDWEIPPIASATVSTPTRVDANTFGTHYGP